MEKRKKEKGFTLIELLAVIVILAIIALIAVPQVLKILNNARKSAAEDSVYGIVKASENYIASFMLNNNGSYPNQDLVFNCGNDGCKLKEEIKEELNNKNYELTNLEILDYKGTKATGGTVTISSNGKDIKVTNLLINGFTCTYENEKASCNKSGNTTTTTTVVEVSKLCRRATTLHTETCSQTDTTYYCSGDGYAEGDTITYGNLGTSGTLVVGDAFDCDVNGDGTYDSVTERFYYVSDSNNGIITDSNVAVLVYYNNVSGGSPSNSTAYAYDESGNNNNGPVTAKEQLPTTEQWSNVNLQYPTTRQITSETGGTTTSAGDLPNAFSYEGYAARLLTYQEVNAGCYDGTTAITEVGSLSSKCKFLMENTKYSNSSLKTYGGWLESPDSSSSNNVWAVYGSTRNVRNNTAGDTGNRGVRPVIEVLKSDISY